MNKNNLKKYSLAFEKDDFKTVLSYINSACKKIRLINKKQIDKNGVPKTNIKGICKCPVCESNDKLSYWVSSYNGHIGFTCECGFNAQQ